MMIRQSTRDGGSMQKHGEITCTRRTETISMQNKEEMGVVIVIVGDGSHSWIVVGVEPDAHQFIVTNLFKGVIGWE
jgi:hypothetical protein